MPANIKPIFQEIFKEYQDYYVLIGGTATSIVLDAHGFESRTTKDYDMVIIDHLKDKAFYHTLLHFLEMGEYIGSQLEESPQLFRFTTKKSGFPEMIELFSILPEYPLKKFSRETPLHFAEEASLSALLLDKDYYQLLVNEKEIIEEYSVLSNRGLSKKIKKHLNDIARLTMLLHEEDALSKINTSNTIVKDMERFVQFLSSEIHSIPQNEDIVLSREEIFEILREFLLS